MTRPTILNAVIGKPWKANAHGPDAFDCWHLARHVQHALFGRGVPDVDVPAHPTWAWMIENIDRHPERQKWRHVPADSMGLVTAKDGALVLMARRDRPAHIGVWLAPERRIIHADANRGVVCESMVDLHTLGWTKLRFYEPIS